MTITRRLRVAASADDGVTALETAVVIPVLLLFVFVIFCFGARMVGEATANQKARATVRYASIVYSGTAPNPGYATTQLGATDDTVTQHTSVYPQQTLVQSFAQAQFQSSAFAEVVSVQFLPGTEPCGSTQVKTTYNKSGQAIFETTTVTGPKHGEKVQLLVTSKVKLIDEVHLLPQVARDQISTIKTTVTAVCE